MCRWKPPPEYWGDTARPAKECGPDGLRDANGNPYVRFCLNKRTGEVLDRALALAGADRVFVRPGRGRVEFTAYKSGVHVTAAVFAAADKVIAELNSREHKQ